MSKKSEWKNLASASKGTEYGHVPGHNYHDVDVTISGRDGKLFRVEVLETWGSAQGYDEEHGRNKVVAIDADLDAAVRIANSRAKEAGICSDYMIQALSSAHADAVDALAEQE